MKIKRGSYERVIEPEWHSETQKMFFYMPPFEWLRASSESNRALPSEDFMIKCINGQVSVFEAFPDSKSSQKIKISNTVNSHSAFKTSGMETEGSNLKSELKQNLDTSKISKKDQTVSNNLLDENYKNENGSEELGEIMEKSETQVCETETSGVDGKGHSVEIYLSLSLGHWQFAGNILYYEPEIADIFPIVMPEGGTIEKLCKHLDSPVKWEFFDLYFGESFVALPNPLELESADEKSEDVLEDITEEPELNPKNASKGKPKNGKKAAAAKPKTVKDLEKLYAQMKEDLVNQPKAPGEYLILLSKKGFVLPAPDRPKFKFSYQKFSNEVQGWFCNPHMIIAEIPEMPYVKTIPEPEPELPPESPSNVNKKKTKKEAKPVEIEMWEVHPVDIRLSLNGQQFGSPLTEGFKFMFVDKSVPTAEREELRDVVIHKKKPKAKK